MSRRSPFYIYFTNRAGALALSLVMTGTYAERFSSFLVDYAPKLRYNNDMNTDTNSTKELAASLLFFGILIAITFIV